MPSPKQQIILVNEFDEPTGEGEKMQVHMDGLLHRAFSVFLFNEKGEMLLQRRALKKYHGGGLWTNACCSHPFPGESSEAAAGRRLQEELGITAELEKIFDFIYRAEVENGLIEHEFDHVFAGKYEGVVDFNQDEVMDICFKTMHQLEEDLNAHPGKFTTWFRIAFPRIKEYWEREFK